MNKTLADWQAEAEAFRAAAHREHDRYRKAQADANNAEIEAAYWKTTAILAQGRLSRLTEGTK